MTILILKEDLPLLRARAGPEKSHQLLAIASAVVQDNMTLGHFAFWNE